MVDMCEDHVIAVFEVMEDIMAPDFVGGNSLDFCEKFNLFHKAYAKGELVFTSLDWIATFLDPEKFDTVIGNENYYITTSAFSKEELNLIYLARLKDGKMADVQQEKLSPQSILYDVWKERRARGGSGASSKYLRFKGCIDGDMLFTKFIETVF